VMSWVVVGCAPPIEGAACRRDAECPSEQTCTESCVCALGERRAEPRCTGFVRVDPVPLSFAGADFLDTSTLGQVVVVAKNDADTKSQVVRFDGVWRAESQRTAEPPSLTPVAVDADGETLIERLFAGRGLTTIRTRSLRDTGEEPLWVGSATAVRFEKREAFASLSGKGLFRKQLGQAQTLDGTRLDAREAVELDVAQDASVIAARFGAEVVTFPGPRTLSTTAARFALAANGSTLAVLDQGGLVQVLRLQNNETVPVLAQRAVALALDGDGSTLALIEVDSMNRQRLVLYRESGGRWVSAGGLPPDVEPSAMALSGDGKRLFVALKGQPTLEVYELRRR
jgi:hypothetical protein